MELFENSSRNSSHIAYALASHTDSHRTRTRIAHTLTQHSYRLHLFLVFVFSTYFSYFNLVLLTLNITNLATYLCLFPLPHQLVAPYFNGKDVTDFIIKWEDLTLDWSDD